MGGASVIERGVVYSTNPNPVITNLSNTIYFAWGEVEPKETCKWSTYKYCNGSYDSLTKGSVSLRKKGKKKSENTKATESPQKS